MEEIGGDHVRAAAIAADHDDDDYHHYTLTYFDLVVHDNRGRKHW